MKGATLIVLGVLALTACTQRPDDAGAAQAASSALSRADQLVLAAAKVALPPPGVVAADLPDPNSQGALLVAKHCGQCHNLPNPATHSATDWPVVTRRMWLRVEGLDTTLAVTAPSASERFVMLNYLVTNALKVSGANLPAGPGREAFQLVCSRCHELPDPKYHSAQDWPTVFARMERNMERMKVPPLHGTQTTDVLLYLQRVSAKR